MSIYYSTSGFLIPVTMSTSLPMVQSESGYRNLPMSGAVETPMAMKASTVMTNFILRTGEVA